jgi:hypothetical protein
MTPCCPHFAVAVHDHEMEKNYAKMGWAWPVDKASGVLPRYVWKWCPWCGSDLPPLLDDEAIKRIMAELFPAPLWPLSSRFPDWMRKPKPDWQADGEGDE